MGPILILSPVGELDAGAASDLTAAVTAGLRRARSVVFDMSGVTFMDCGALGALVACTQQAEEVGSRVQAAALPLHVRRLFGVFDLHQVLGGRHDVATECRRSLRHLSTSRSTRSPISA